MLVTEMKAVRKRMVVKVERGRATMICNLILQIQIRNLTFDDEHQSEGSRYDYPANNALKHMDQTAYDNI